MKVFEVFIKMDDADDEIDYDALGMDRPFKWQVGYLDLEATIGYFLNDATGTDNAIIVVFSGHDYYIKYDRKIHGYLKERFNGVL